MAAAQTKGRASTGRDLFWPYGRRRALLAVPLVLLVLAIVLALLQRIFGWPPAGSTNLVLIGIFILSFTPLLLALLDRVAERGGGLELPMIKLNFAAVVSPSQPVTLAANIGVTGMPISDSTSQMILDTLRTAVNHEVVVLDLEIGQSWWETRLVVLCAGAVRLRHPGAIVFLATQAQGSGHFQGWARPDALLALLLALNSEYKRAYLEAHVAAAQWAQVTPPGPGQASPPALYGMSRLASTGAFVAPFINGEVNDLAPEQFLALALGNLEFAPGPLPISPLQLKGTYAAALHTDSIDQSWPAEQQTRLFLSSDLPYVAVTDRGRYLSLLPREAGLTSILAAIVEREQTPPSCSSHEGC
jgi:hypothetical protein